MVNRRCVLSLRKVTERNTRPVALRTGPILKSEIKKRVAQRGALFLFSIVAFVQIEKGLFDLHFRVFGAVPLCVLPLLEQEGIFGE